MLVVAASLASPHPAELATTQGEVSEAPAEGENVDARHYYHRRPYSRPHYGGSYYNNGYASGYNGGYNNYNGYNSYGYSNNHYGGYNRNYVLVSKLRRLVIRDCI